MKTRPDTPTKVPLPAFAYSKGPTEQPKTSGIKVRGGKAQTKGKMARGPMA